MFPHIYMELKDWRSQMKVDCGLGVTLEPIVRITLIKLKEVK